MSNWTVKWPNGGPNSCILFWKGIRLTDMMNDIPFLALMLGDSKGVVSGIRDGAKSKVVSLNYRLGLEILVQDTFFSCVYVDR